MDQKNESLGAGGTEAQESNATVECSASSLSENANGVKSKSRKDILREINAMLGNCCTVCSKPFAHSDGTCGGVLRSGSAAYVAACCVGKLSECHGIGVHLKTGGQA